MVDEKFKKMIELFMEDQVELFYYNILPEAMYLLNKKIANENAISHSLDNLIEIFNFSLDKDYYPDEWKLGNKLIQGLLYNLKQLNKNAYEDYNECYEKLKRGEEAVLN